jgi:hypothetical protein
VLGRLATRCCCVAQPEVCACPGPPQLDEFDEGKGAIEVNPLFVTWNRKWRLGREGAWWEVPLDTKLGMTYTGAPRPCF